MKITRFSSSLCFVGVLLLTLTACDPVPRRTLTPEEKKADLLWIYSQFGQNYAPLRYKEQRFGIDFETLKERYLQAADATATNEEFYRLMLSLIAEFRDAHTSGALTQSTLPGRVKIAYLGFTGAREKGSLLIQSVLPTIADGSEYPLKKGDRILQLDGVPVLERARDLFRFRELGREESNLTYHLNKLFTRVSTMSEFPSAPDAELVVKRGTNQFTVRLPWIIKDIVQFQAEQDRAKEERDRAAGKKTSESGKYAVLSDDHQKLFSLSLVGFDGRIEFPLELIARITRATRKTVLDSFQLVDAFAGWIVAEEPRAETPVERVKSLREVPETAVFLDMAKVYPAYVSREKRGDGTTELVGTVLIDTFSPSAESKVVLKEFKDTLKAFQELGVTNLVLDLINNGGGSLQLGMQMAQALSSTRIVDPTIQFRLSDSWMDNFENDSIAAGSNSGREISRRVLSDLKADLDTGLWLSRPYPIEVLMPYALVPNPDVKRPFGIAVLVNEMCASMCDIFSAALQDNALATVVGTNSMGAGGNVVNYQQAPNSHLDLRQTESLIFRKDGSPIENNGTAPDVFVKVSDHTSTKYQAVRAAAVKALLKR